jgi:hypothetical protein
MIKVGKTTNVARTYYLSDTHCVYVLHEGPSKEHPDGWVHGIYDKREMAEKARERLRLKRLESDDYLSKGKEIPYSSVLKLPIKGLIKLDCTVNLYGELKWTE